MNLAVGSVLASAQMSDLEGTELTFDLSASKGVGKIDESLAAGFPLDDLAGSAGAFKVLRELVARWEKASLSSAVRNRYLLSFSSKKPRLVRQ